jgi:hypothetical protein
MIDSPEKVPGALDDSQPTGWEDVAAMANKYPKGDEIVDSTKPEESSKFTEMKNLEEIHNCEIDMVAENPDVLGYNIDSKLIIWPERRKQAIRAKEFLDSGGDIAVLSEQFGLPAGRIQEAIDDELLKDKMLDDMLSRLPEGVIFRINPHAPQSVFSVANSERITNENGENRFRIDSDVMTQVRKIREKAAGSELLVVMNQLHEDEDGELTSNIPENSADYIALCQSFIEQSGYSEQAGKGLVLELGNECNMSHESNGPLFKTEAFAETVDAEAYANFYFETAKALKASFPDIKLSLTGTAFYDYDFTKQVIDIIQVRKDADESLKETKLIDVISFHPYRRTVESPAPFMSNGKELSEPEVRKRSQEYWESLSAEEKDTFKQEVLAGLTEEEKAIAAKLSNEEIESSIAYKAYANFDHQLESLREIADQIGAEVTVGEISFYAGEWGESIDENEQERNAVYGREMGYTSLLWPGEQIVKHENPERRKYSESNK